MRLQKCIKRDFTSVHNAFLKDEELSLSARGMLITMLSFPENWNFSIRGLSKLLNNDGERKISTALNELEKHGYLARIRECDASGRITDWLYVFSDEKLPEETLKKSFKSRKKASVVVDCDEQSDDVFPDMQNADVADTYEDNSYMQDSHEKKRSNNKYTKDQILKKEISNDLNINQSNHDTAGEESKSDRYDEMDLYKQIIDERICYDALMLDYEDPDCRYPGTAEKMTEIRDIMLECVCSGKKTIRVSGEDIPQDRVRAVMLGLNSNHIMYVMECMEETNTEIKSIRSYLITALYNAPSTMSNYYASQASHMLSVKKEDSCKSSDYSGVKPLF